MASGTSTNNLHDWQQARHGDGVDSSDVQRFSDWVAEQLSLGCTEAADGLRAIAGGCAPLSDWASGGVRTFRLDVA